MRQVTDARSYLGCHHQSLLMMIQLNKICS